MIPGAGHLPQMEDPEPVRRAVLGFLDRPGDH
jgi:pimeloyl-ACP methyl ester carboxylesterase